LPEMPESKNRLIFNRQFAPDEFQQISRGLIPESMDDKWFIFLEDNWLYLHRSWTGSCIYKVKFEQDQGSYMVSEAWVNRDRNQYNSTDDNYDAAVLSFLIDKFLLGKDTPFPMPSVPATTAPK